MTTQPRIDLTPREEPQPTPKYWTVGLASTLSGAVATTALCLGHIGSLQPLTDSTQRPPIVRQMQPPQVASEASAGTKPLRNSAAIIKELHAKSGLTWEQLGRAFGVSRRAVHLWAAGGRINAHHSELLVALTAIVDSLPATEPDDRRILIFEPRQGSASIFDEFLRQRSAQNVAVVDPPLPPAQLLGVRYGVE